MKTQSTSTEMRAGLISLLVLILCYLWFTGIPDTFRACVFIVSFAICFVLMIQAIIDLLVAAFGFAASISG